MAAVPPVTSVPHTTVPIITTVPLKTTTVPTVATTTPIPKTTTVPHTTTTTVAAVPKTSTASSTLQTTLTTTTPAISSSTAANSNGGGGMSGGSVAGMVVGVIVVLVGSIVGGFLLLKQRRKRMMLVGRKARNYNGYPEPDTNRPPMAPFRREGQSPGSRGGSGYGVQPPADRSIASEGEFYDDRNYHAAVAGLGGARTTSGHGSASGSGESYTQLSNGMFVATGRRDADVMPVRRAYRLPEAEGDIRRESAVPDSLELEREREIDLQQQARLLQSEGEPIQSPTSSRSPTSPHNSNPQRFPLPGYGYNVNPGPPHPNAYYQQQQHQQQYGPHSGYYQSQPISTGGFPQYPQVFHPQSQYYVPSQQQQFFPPPTWETSPSSGKMNGVPMRQMPPSQYQLQERHPDLSADKQEIEEAQHQYPDSNSPPQTSTLAADSIKSGNSTEFLHHGSQLKQTNRISEVLPSMGVGEPSGTGAGKEEYLEGQPSTVEPTEYHTLNAEVPAASPPPVPTFTKPRN